MFDSRIKYMMSALAGVCMMAGSAAADQLPEFWHYMGTGGEYDGVKGMIEAVNKQNPSAPVTERAVPGNAPGLRQQIQVAVMGGTPPLAYQFNMGWDLVEVAETGRVLPIDDVWQKIDGDKAFPASLRNVVSFGGHHYAIPLAISVISDVYYNKKMFADLGLKPPASWEDWQEICKKVEAAGKACLSHNAGFPWGLYNMYSVIISDLGIDGYWKLARGEPGVQRSGNARCLRALRGTVRQALYQELDRQYGMVGWRRRSDARRCRDVDGRKLDGRLHEDARLEAG